jgi:5-methylcytosine-specific restriction protein A
MRIHRPQWNIRQPRAVAERRAREDAARENKQARHLYNTAAWRRLRVRVLREEPVCRVCGRAPSTQVDHIRPHDGDVYLFADRANCQGVCAPCHSRKTATEDGGWGRARRDRGDAGT